MFPPRALFRTLFPILALALLLGGCVMPARQDAAPAPSPAEPAVAEPTPEPEMPPEDLTAVVNQNANVRTGPGTGNPIAYWLTAGTEVTVTGRNEEGTWLQIEHDDRPGWISAALTEIAGEMAAMPDAEPTVEPPVEPTPATVATDRVAATVTGTAVNLRVGPGTEHATAGQARAGDVLHVTGRNADGSWLQVMHPADTSELVWIYGPLTDIDGAAILALAEVGAVEVEVAAQPTPEEPTAPAATPEPAALPPEATEAIADCTQWHTVNPNETRLSQITDWFGLDLQLVEAINHFADTEPLEAGMRLCLRTSGIDTTLAPATEPEVAIEVPAAEPEPQPVAAPVVAGVCRTHKGQVQPCPSLPDYPERGRPHAPIGQKVVDSPLGIIWHAPGSYSRDLPGLDYDFELVFSDDSAMWDWSVRDFNACYDAVRVHMDTIPSEVGLQRLEVRLSDPVYDEGGSGWAYGTTYQSPWANMSGLPWDEWPNWNLANVPHPDLAQVNLGCSHLQSDGQVFCRIRPRWGNSHSIHLNAAVTLALANTAAAFSDDAREYRHNRLDQRTIDFNAYLFPLLDDRRGSPAGQGPCLDVARAR